MYKLKDFDSRYTELTFEGGWVFDIYHSIDDSYTHFTETAFKQVLTGDRSPWDGDINIEYEDRL